MSSDIKWKTVSVGEALTLVNGRAFKPTEWKQTGLPIIRIQNLNNSNAQFNYYDGDLPEKFLVNSGDLLFAWSGTPGTSFGAHIWKNGKAWLNQHIFKVVFNKDDFDKRFLQLAINQNLQEYIRQAHGGAGLAHITKGTFEASEIPKPSIDVQVKIVSEIDTQFSRLDEAVASLKRIQANLKRYKAAVLKSAVEGKLTEQWRKKHPVVEPADQLLKRILTERRAKWEAEELAKIQAKGIKPKDDSWKKKYKEPAGPDTANLPELPVGWVWANLEQLLCFLRNGISAKPDADTGLPILRISAVRPMLVKLDEVRYLSSDEDEYLNYALSAGDLLFTRYNGNPDLVGVCGVVPELSTVVVHPDKLIRCKLASSVSIPKFVAHMANIGSSREYLAQRVRTTAGQAGISGTDLRGMPIPLPPHAEQQAILEEIDRRLSVTEELETTIETNLKRAESLRQTILQRAFSGGAV